VIGGGSGVLLQQGEAPRKVRGELNRSEKLWRWRSPSQGGDGGDGSKYGGAGVPPVVVSDRSQGRGFVEGHAALIEGDRAR
jgi:hypothetical protein